MGSRCPGSRLCGNDEYGEDGTAACLDRQACAMKGPAHRHPLGPLYIEPCRDGAWTGCILLRFLHFFFVLQEGGITVRWATRRGFRWGEARANCWTGFGSGCLGRQRASMHNHAKWGSYPPPATCARKRDLGGPLCFGNRAMPAGEAEVRGVPQPRKLATGACGEWQLARFSGLIQRWWFRQTCLFVSFAV